MLGPQGRLARDIDAAVAAAGRPRGCQGMLSRWRCACAALLQPSAGQYLRAGPAPPALGQAILRSGDAFLLALVCEHGSIASSEAFLALSEQLLLRDESFVDPWDHPAVNGPWLWRAVANQIIADAVDRGVLVVERRPPPGLRM